MLLGALSPVEIEAVAGEADGAIPEERLPAAPPPLRFLPLDCFLGALLTSVEGDAGVEPSLLASATVICEDESLWMVGASRWSSVAGGCGTGDLTSSPAADNGGGDDDRIGVEASTIPTNDVDVEASGAWMLAPPEPSVDGDTDGALEDGDGDGEGE